MKNYLKVSVYHNLQFQRVLKATPNVICVLTFILLMWRIWLAPNNASKWQMGFNSVFEVLKTIFGSFCNN
jgi:hypothetical protein